MRQQTGSQVYLHQRLGGGGAALGGKLDLYRVFAERMVGLLGGDGAIGMVVPSAFHANEGATGIRKFLSAAHADGAMSVVRKPQEPVRHTREIQVCSDRRAAARTHKRDALWHFI